MSVATKNPFAVLESEDPSRPPTPAAPPPQDTTQPSPGAPQPSQKSKGGPASRAGRYYSRGGGSHKSAREQTADDAAAPSAADAHPGRSDADGRGRGRGRGRGGSRGGGGGRGRQYDRHSGSGKTDSDKKLHQSWGGDDGNTELKVEQAAVDDAAAEGDNDWAGNQGSWADPVSNDWGVDTSANNNDAWGAVATPTVDAEPEIPGSPDADKPAQGREGRKGRETEEEDKTLTLDQYLAQQKQGEAVPKLEGIRKANDGADDIWKDAVQLKKDQQQDAYFVGKTKTSGKPRAKKEEKVYIDIEARFERPARGGRGGRGGDRGDRGDRPRRGRGAYRGRSNGPAPVVDVDDETAFPSLS